MLIRLLIPSLPSLKHTTASESVTARLNFLIMSSRLSRIAIYAFGFESDLLIFFAGSQSDIILIPVRGI